MLIQQLRALENDGIVARTVFAEVPPHVEYELTEAGMALVPAMTALANWANDNTPRRRHPGPWKLNRHP